MSDDSTTPPGVNGAGGKPDDTSSTEVTETMDAVGDPADGAATAQSTQPRSEKLEKQNRRFSRWRKERPFAAGLLMMLAGVVIMAPAYLSFQISNIQIQISTMGGVSTLVIGILLITCGLMCWFRGEGRILAGVAALILSILALWQSNFGGFGVGLILGLVGGALALAWDPQPRQEAKAEKAEKKEARKARKAEKAGKKSSGAGSAKSVIAVLAAVAVGVGVQTPDARAQIPGLPDIQLPELEIPGQGNGNGNGNGGTGDGRTDGNRGNTPRLPNLPPLPEAPDLNLPEFRMPDGNELQDGLDNSLEKLGVEIPGLNVAPPEPVAGMQTPFGGTFTIKTDTAKMTPGMKLSYVTIDTMQGPKKAIRIDADKAVMENLRVQFPNALGNDLLDDTEGATSTLTGNFHIFVQELTMTLELLGVDTMLPITINADWAPDDIAKELSKIGLGLPDLLSAETRVLDVRLETYHVMADFMDYPRKNIGPWHEN
ncbi:DUF6114 domain-containing protein [Corynebacteriaceae bacterium 7-707]